MADETFRERALKEIPLFTPEVMSEALAALGPAAELYETSFKSVERCVLFLGYPRSGHSMTGALIDAHPQAICAHELNVLELCEQGMSRLQLFYLLLLNSRLFAELGRTWGPYSYAVPGQWQGAFTTLKVIGDKKGAGTVDVLRRSPQVLEQARKVLGPELRFLHVIRNPFDNISTLHRKHKPLVGRSLDDAIDHYFEYCEGIEQTQRRLSDQECIDIYHEDFCESPKAGMETIFRFLELTPDPALIQSCASIVQPVPRKTRGGPEWRPEHIRKVNERIDRYPFLHRYLNSNNSNS